MQRKRFSGVYPILYAFYDAVGRLDPAAMAAQVEHCIAQGAHGIAVLGLVTEVNRLTTAERQHVVEMVGATIAGRVPYAVTIAEHEPQAQIDFARMAARNGADWVILQPPPGKGLSEDVLFAHFGTIADAAPLPVAIQNNPVNLDSSLSPDGLATLLRRHRNISLLKAEGWSVDIARVIALLDGEVDAFGGHGGLEFISLMASGGAGLIPAPDVLALQVAMFDALRSGDEEAGRLAGQIHREILPLVVFMTRNIGGLLTYGKRLMARRLRFDIVHDRQPLPAATAFGLAEMERLYADALDTERRLLPRIRARLDYLRTAS